MAAELEFGLLGPLMVHVDGTAVLVARGRERATLAVLLMNAGQMVSADQLVEALWGQSPPPSGRITVRNYVMRLRHTLGDAGADRIRTQSPGYRMSVDARELDVSRFEALTESATKAAASGSWQVAVSQAAQALALWRGEPLADVDSEVLAVREVPRLRELRLQAEQTRIEAQLQLGAHGEVIAELRRLVAMHPLREHLHTLLMCALYRSGRQADALAAYQDAREILTTEVGAEPGPGMRNLHQRILAADPALDWRPPAPDSATVAAPAELPGQARNLVPRQLPAAVRHFTGRRDELHALAGVPDQDAAGTIVISAIDGMAGVGKTALAIQAAHRLSAQFPGGQLFIDLHGYTDGHDPRRPGEALDWLLRTLGVPAPRIPQDVEEKAALYRQRLAGTRTLVVLDNAASEAQVRPLLPGSEGCLVLVTSRRRLKGLDDAHVVALDVLPDADALALLRAVAGPARIAADDPALAEVASLCGRLPLALRIAGALLRHRPAWTPEHLAGLLRDQRQRLDVLSDGDRDLGAALDLSYGSLPGDRQAMFRCLGLVPGPDADAYAAAALAGTDPAAATRMLEGLVDHNLLIAHTPGRYRLHDLIRLHAAALAARDGVDGGGSADDRHAALGRLLDYYQHTAARADALIARWPLPGPARPGPAHAPALPDPNAAQDWLRAERLNLLAAVQDAASRACHQRVVGLTAGLASLLRNDGPWNQAVALHTAAAAAARSSGDRLGQAEALAQMGYVQVLTGDFSDAARRLEQAVDLYADGADPLGRANALARLGEVRRAMGDYPDAARCLEQALQLYRDLGERRGQASALAGLGNIRKVTCDFAAAARDLQEALQLFRDLGEPRGRANALTRLAELRLATGDFPDAAGDLQEALAVFRDLGDRLGQANTLIQLGQAWHAGGDFPAAARDQQQAFELCQDLGEPLGQASALGYLGQVRLAEGDYLSAARHLEAAIDLYRRIGSCGGQAWALNYYAAVLTATGDHARARGLHQQALDLARQTHQPDDEARALEGIGECHLRGGDAQAGATHLRQALEVYQSLAMTPDADRVQARLPA